MIPTPRRVRRSLGPAAVSLAVGIAVLAVGLFVNGCRINKLLSRSVAESADGPLQVTPAAVHDSALAGSTAPRSASLQVVHGGSWSARNDSPWIGLSPVNGSGSRPLTIALHPEALGPGPHQGTVTVTAPDAAGSPVTVPVKFVIQQPILIVRPDDINRTTRSSNGQLRDTLEVENGGNGPLVWTASNTSNWLTLGTVAGVGAGTIPLTMSSAGLPVGTYRDTVVVVAVGASGSPAKIEVTFRRRRDD